MKITKKRKLIILLLLWTILFLFSAWLYVSQRGGEDYTKDLATLIPADCVVYLTINDLDELIKQIAHSSYMERWVDNGAMDLILKKNKRWKKWQKKKKKYAFLLPYDSEMEFVNRWMGKQVIGGIIYAEGETRPGIILASRTRIGFEEKLATFVLEHYPELGLQKEKYRDRQIVIYKGKKEKRGFCYTLFGRTVVLSLRSPSPVYIKKIIDTYYAGEGHSIAGRKRFKDTIGTIESEKKILCYADLQRLPDLFTDFRKTIRNKDKKIKEAVAVLTKNYEYGTLVMDVDKTALNLRLVFYADGNKRNIQKMNSEFSKIRNFVNTLPINKNRDLVWIVSQINPELLQAVGKLFTRDAEQEISPEINNILKPLYSSGLTTGSMNIGFFLQGESGQAFQSPIFSGIMAELPEENIDTRELTSTILNLLASLIKDVPEVINSHKGEQDEVSDSRWWRWRKPPFPAMGYYNNKIVCFIPAEKFEQILRGLSNQNVQSQRFREIISDCQKFVFAEPIAVHFYASVNLKEMGRTLAQLSQIISYFTKEKKNLQEVELWGKIISGFEHGKIFSITTQDNNLELLTLLDSLPEQK